jgi:hypothetical protein
MTVDLDTRVDMYLRPTATATYDWIPINRANGMVVQRSDDVVITDGNQNLNKDVGVPNRAKFAVLDPAGHLNPQNPMGNYWGSVGLGTQTRIYVMRVDDQFGRTVANTNWGSVGNTTALPPNGDTWTAGSSTGGSVLAADWSVSGGTARHSLPVAGSYRLSEMSKTTRLFLNVGVLLHTTVPTSNVTGTGALATEVWLRTVDVSNFLSVSVAFQTNESVQIAILDRTAGVNRYLLNYTTIPGVNFSANQQVLLRCHAEGSTVRAKVWLVGTPEPQNYQVSGNNAVIREGYVSVADFAFSGNTNTYPLVFQHSYIQVDVPVHFGEISNLVPSGDGKSDAKKAYVDSAGVLDSIKANKTTTMSVMRRERSEYKRWLAIGSSRSATGGDTRTVTMLNATAVNIQAGDFFRSYSLSTGRRFEDTLFTVTSTSANPGAPGTHTDLAFTPDARDAVTSDTVIVVYRASVLGATPLAYWPMEDGDSATQISSGRLGGAPMSIVGSPDFGAESGFKASDAILKINDAELTAPIPDYNYIFVTAITIQFLLSMPDTDEAATGTDLIQWYMTGTGYSYDLRYTANGAGSLQLLVFNSTGTQLFDSGNIDFSMRGGKGLISLTLEDVGGSVNYRLFKIGDTGSIGGVGPATVTGVTSLGKITQIRVNPGGGYSSVGFGHLTVVPDLWTWETIYPEFTAWSGQHATARYARLCYENQVPFTFRSDPLGDVVSASLGAQKSGKLSDVIEDPAETDDGFLLGARGALALEYITRGALCNLSPMATFSVAAGHIKLPFEPTADYSNVENRVTVKRIDGTTAVSELTSGPLSTAEPPDGVRLRPGSYQLSMASDTAAQPHADWRKSVGTQNKYRVPAINVTAAGASTLTVERMLSLMVGMRIDISGLANKNIYDTLQLLVSGTSMRLGKREYPQLTMVGQPYDVYRSAALTGNDYARPDMTDTKLGTAISSSYTGSINLTSDAGYYLVTTLASDFPLDIMLEGEQITLSSASGDTSPQTAVISARAVNGVPKAHAIGETVVLYRPNRIQFRGS